jgi:hypothetical protein
MEPGFFCVTGEDSNKTICFKDTCFIDNSCNEVIESLKRDAKSAYLVGIVLCCIILLLLLYSEIKDTLIKIARWLGFLTVDYSLLKIEISFNKATGHTEWINRLGHPLAGCGQKVGPFMFPVGSDSKTTLSTWKTENYITLTEVPGISNRAELKSASKRIDKWNTGICTPMSSERKVIDCLIGLRKINLDLERRKTKYLGVYVVSDPNYISDGEIEGFSD